MKTHVEITPESPEMKSAAVDFIQESPAVKSTDVDDTGKVLFMSLSVVNNSFSQ